MGTYEAAGFPRYTTAVDGYPTTTDVDFRMLIGYAANAERFEDWRTNPSRCATASSRAMASPR